MIRNILIKFSNMKLRNQLILLASIQIVIIVSVVFTLNIVHFDLLINNFSFYSDQIFKKYSNQIQSNIMQMERRYLERVFYLNGNSLITFHRLYHATKKQVMENTLQVNNNFQMYYAGTTKIPDPLRIIQGYGNFDISYSFMCYSNLSAYNNPKTIDELIAIKMQEQIQSYGQLIQIGKSINQYFIYSYIVKEKITSIYPCLNRKQGIYSYKPEERDWYIELKRNYDSKQIYDSYNYSFTKPFQLFTEKKMGLSTAMPIVDENLQMIGGVGSIFLGNEFMKSINQTESGFQKIAYLISDDGVMIMHPYKTENQFEKIYLYNESITGFNYTDWLEIKSNSGQSSCPIFAKYQSHLKCRFNSLYQQEMIIGIHVIQEFHMILITLLSSYEYLEFYQQFQEQLEQRFSKIEQNETLFQVGLFVIVCSCIVIFTQILFYPIKLLQRKTLNKIQKKKYTMTAKFPNLTEYLMSEQIRQLSQAFKFFENKLDMLSFIKTTQCCEFENIQYPKKQYQFRFYSSGYSLFLQNGIDLSKTMNQNSDLFDICAILKLLHKNFHPDQ